MKKNVTTRAFIEATGKPAFQALQSEDEGGSQESGEETLSDEEGGEEEKPRGGPKKAGRKASKPPQI